MNTVIYLQTTKPGGAELAAGQLACSLNASLIVWGQGDLSKLRIPTSVHTERFHGSGLFSSLGALGKIFETIQANLILFKVLQKTKPTLLIANNIQGTLHTSLACKLLRIKHVSYVRDLGQGGNRSAVQIWFWKRVLRLSDGQIFNSNLTMTSWNLKGPNTVAYPAVEERFFEAQHSTTGSGGLLMVSRLTAWKGISETIRAIDALENKSEASLKILGESLFAGDKHAPISSSHQVSYLGFSGSVEKEMEQCSVFIHASITPEPFGQVLAQAAAVGVPIICSSRGGHLEWLRDGVSCLAVDPKNQPEFTRAIERLTFDPIFAQKLGRAAKAKAVMFKPGVTYKDLPQWLDAIAQSSGRDEK